ncbi:MAG: cation diffusion facilitator family transporter [Clostridia bacterium]
MKDYKNTSDQNVRTRYGMFSGIIGIILNIILFVGKAIAGIVSGAISITADAFNNLSDAGSSVVTLLGFKLANQEADDKHPFGHGRIEYLAGLIVSFVIIFMGFELAKTSLDKIINPTDVTFSVLSICILGFSIVVKLWMFFYNTYLSKKISSETLKAVSMDSISDVVATTVVLLGTLFAHFFKFNIDGYLGIAVSIFILYSGFCAAKETINPLLGQPLDPEFVKKITDLILSHDKIHGIHDLVIHNYGVSKYMMTLHAEVPYNENLIEIHDIIDDIERDIYREFNVIATIHMDPIETDDVETNIMLMKITDILKDIDERLTLHDFRMTKAHTHCNFIFDVVVPHKFHLSETDLTALICEKIKELDETYFAVITIDKSFIATK